MSLARLVGTFGAAPSLLRNRTFFRRWKIDAGTACLRQTYRNRLFSGASTVYAFPDVMHFFTNELARLCTRGFPFRLSFLALSKVCFSGMTSS